MTLTYRSTIGRRLTVVEGDGNISHFSKASFVYATSHEVIGDGTTDDTTAFNNARTAARAIKARLVITGTPLITAALTIATKEHWVFDGAVGNSSGNRPDSYLLKDNALTADLVTITAPDTIIEGGGILGQSGNTGDGYVIKANGVVLMWPYVEACGNDGIRVGTSGGVNANSFVLYRPTCSLNGRYGINLDDLPGGGSNANAGTVFQPLAQNNGSHGIYVNGSFYSSIINPLAESNTGYGIYLDTNSRTKIYGGDSESNTAGDLFQVNTHNNEIYSLNVGGYDYSTSYQVGTFAPGETGGEILQNGGFGSDTIWVKAGSSSISGGALNLPANTSASQNFKTVVDHSYTLTVTITGAATRNIIRVGSTGPSSFDLVNAGYLTTAETFKYTFTAVSQITTVSFLNDVGSDTTSTWDNASIKGNIAASAKLYPATPAEAKQTAAGLFAGTGAPNNANGSNGDFYLRGDGTAAGNTVIYHKEAGAWAALVTT